uniref:Defensin-like protein n=1 Tax=Strongyloides papillosus TaxID=174720 RepID=A0A0N5BYD8_STREA
MFQKGIKYIIVINNMKIIFINVILTFILFIHEVNCAHRIILNPCDDASCSAHCAFEGKTNGHCIKVVKNRNKRSIGLSECHCV